MRFAKVKDAYLAAAVSRLVRQTGWAEGLALAFGGFRDHAADPLMSKPSLALVSAGLSAIAQAMAWTKALDWLSACQSQFRPDVVIYNATAAACGRASQWQWSLHLLSEPMCLRSRLHSDAVSLNILISACGRATEWELALALATGRCKLKSQLRPHAVVEAKGIGAAIDALGRTGHWNIALTLLHEIQIRRVLLSIGCFNAAITAAARSEQWMHAVQCLDSIRRIGLAPTAVTKGAEISALGRATLWQQSCAALELYRLGSSAALTSSSSSHVNLTMLNASLGSCSRASRWEQAYVLFEQMPSMRLIPDALSIASVVSSCAAAFKWKHALELLQVKPGWKGLGLELSASLSWVSVPRVSWWVLQGLMRRLCVLLLRSSPKSEQEFGTALLAWDVLKQSPPELLSLPARSKEQRFEGFERLHHRKVAAHAFACLGSLRRAEVDGRSPTLELIYDLGPDLSKLGLEENTAHARAGETFCTRRRGLRRLHEKYRK